MSGLLYCEPTTEAWKAREMGSTLCGAAGLIKGNKDILSLCLPGPELEF